MVVEFSVIPMGRGIGISSELAKVMRLVDDSGLDYRVGPMCTVLEGEWGPVMELIQRCHQRVRVGSARVMTTIKIDDRKGAQSRMTGKVASVVQKSGRRLKT